MRDIEAVLDKLHVPFVESITHFPCRGGQPPITYPDYVISSYGKACHPMIWMATEGRTASQQGKNLSKAISEYTGRDYPDQDYVCNLYVRRADRVGILENFKYV
jgi:hypothetical protein